MSAPQLQADAACEPAASSAASVERSKAQSFAPQEDESSLAAAERTASRGQSPAAVPMAEPKDAAAVDASCAAAASAQDASSAVEAPAESAGTSGRGAAAQSPAPGGQSAEDVVAAGSSAARRSSVGESSAPAASAPQMSRLPQYQDLLDRKVLAHGDRVFCTRRKGKQFYGDLLDDGRIRYSSKCVYVLEKVCVCV